MDMLPPQAPPAITHTENQETRDVAQRLIEAQDWLITQNEQLPEPADSVTAGTLETYLGRLASFWQAPVAGNPGTADLPRSTVFAQRLASVMKDEATLRYLDGTLDERARELALAFARAQGSTLPVHVQAHELVFGQVAYAGAVVLVDDRADDRALLFSPTRGWETFANLDALYKDTEERARRSLATDEMLPGMAADDIGNVIDRESFVTSRAIEGDAFDTLVARIVQVQAAHATAAWAGGDAPLPPERDLTQDMGLHHYLDIRSIVMERNARLHEVIVDEQLARMPDAAQAAWRQARLAYADELKLADATLREFAIGEVRSLDDFASERLGKALAERGINGDPRRMVVDVYPVPASSIDQALNPVPALGMAALRPAAGTLLASPTLLELALQNIAPLDNTLFLARDHDGSDLTPRLPSAALVAMIRGLDVAGHYRDYLLGELDSSAEGQLRRVVSTGLQHKRMRLELEDARLGDYQPDAVMSFRPDRNHRGYEWVRAVLDAPEASKRATVDGHAIIVRQLTYKGEPVKDVLIISTAQPQAVPNMVLYTPNAPDGRAFREFRDGMKANDGFFYNRAFEQYLIDRLPLDVSEPLPNGAGRRFKVPAGSSLAQWVFSSTGKPGTRVAESFDERTVDGNVLDALHEAGISLLSRNLSSLARSTREANADSLPSVDAEAVARSVAWLIGRPFRAAWRAYDDVRAGDHAGAFVAGTEAYVASLDFLGAGPLASRVVVPLVGRISRHSGRLVPLGSRMRSADMIQEPRFVARNVDPTTATSVDNGVYTVGDARYIRQGETMYGVRYDDQLGTWRLRRPDAGPTSYGPPIARDATTGTWMRNREFGILGGMDNPARRAVIGDEAGRRLSPWQQQVAASVLLRAVGRAETMHIAMTLRTGGRAALLPRHRRALIDALDRARAAPVVRPLPSGATDAAGPGANPVYPQPGPATAPVPAHRPATVPASHTGPGAPLPPPRWAPPAQVNQVAPLDLSVRVETLAPAEWPDFVWHYETHPRFRVSYGEGLMFNHLQLPYAPHPGIRVHATQPLQEFHPPMTGNGLLEPPLPWVQINLRQMRQQAVPRVRLTRVTVSGYTHYVLGGATPGWWFRLQPGDFLQMR